MLSIRVSRVSFETSFDSKQPKLEPKLVLALSETKCLFRLFRFYTETESFDVSIEPKQTQDQPKQFKREYRVAAISPEHFQTFTVALKIIFEIIFLAPNRLSCLLKHK
jgi:hypothetical protein